MSYSQFGYAYPAAPQILGAAEGCSPPTQSPRLLSSFPHLAGFSLYASPPYAPHDALTPHNAFYTALPPYELKEGRSAAWMQGSACYSYDAISAPYSPDRFGPMDSAARRKNATRETTNTLKAWLYEHRKNPYPTKGEKIMLAIITKMTLTQVSTWFANARRRLKKENKMTWEPRNKAEGGRDTPLDDDPRSDDNSDICPNYVKRESTNFNEKHGYSAEFEEAISGGKESYELGCCKVQSHSSEDSRTSESPISPTCFAAPSKEHVFEPSVFDQRPKIWSLARTATSNSPPPNNRRSNHDPKDMTSRQHPRFAICPIEDLHNSGTRFASAASTPVVDKNEDSCSQKEFSAQRQVSNFCEQKVDMPSSGTNISLPRSVSKPDRCKEDINSRSSLTGYCEQKLNFCTSSHEDLASKMTFCSQPNKPEGQVLDFQQGFCIEALQQQKIDFGSSATCQHQKSNLVEFGIVDKTQYVQADKNEFCVQNLESKANENCASVGVEYTNTSNNMQMYNSLQFKSECSVDRASCMFPSSECFEQSRGKPGLRKNGFFEDTALDPGSVLGRE